MARGVLFKFGWTTGAVTTGVGVLFVVLFGVLAVLVHGAAVGFVPGVVGGVVTGVAVAGTLVFP